MEPFLCSHWRLEDCSTAGLQGHTVGNNLIFSSLSQPATFPSASPLTSTRTRNSVLKLFVAPASLLCSPSLTGSIVHSANVLVSERKAHSLLSSLLCTLKRTRGEQGSTGGTVPQLRVSAVFCQIYFLKDFNVKGRTSQLWSAVGQLGCTSCEMCARAAVAAHQAAPKLSFSPLLDLAQLQPWPLQPSPVMWSQLQDILFDKYFSNICI